MGLVHFVESVLIGVKNNVVTNLDYFHLIKDMDRFNDLVGGVDGDDEKEEERKANKRGQIAKWGCKAFTCAFQSTHAMLFSKFHVKNRSSFIK
ncbi:unnamed protein product [Malus baccata var. baccata]